MQDNPEGRKCSKGLETNRCRLEKGCADGGVRVTGN